jgi:hypothetical protein
LRGRKDDLTANDKKLIVDGECEKQQSGEAGGAKGGIIYLSQFYLSSPSSLLSIPPIHLAGFLEQGLIG